MAETRTSWRFILLWVAVNGCAIALWLWDASVIWPEFPYEHCDPGVGDAFYFFFRVVPLFAIALAAQVTALVVGAARLRRHFERGLLVLAMVTTAAWIVAAIYDLHRGYRYVTDECPITQ